MTQWTSFQEYYLFNQGNKIYHECEFKSIFYTQKVQYQKTKSRGRND